MKRAISSLHFVLMLVVFRTWCHGSEPPTQADIDSVKRYIASEWPKTVRPAASGYIPLPKPFTVPCVPGKRGVEMFCYWDTYFTSVGLVSNGLTSAATDNAEDMMFFIEKLGFVPNYSGELGITRSQPPVAALQIALCLTYNTSKEWRKRAYLALEREYSFWVSNRSFPDGLSHYGNHATPSQQERVFEAECRARLKPTIPDEPVAREKFVSHALAEAESGWDFSPRWGDHCMEIASVDLNSLLYVTESVEAGLSRELNNGKEAFWLGRMKSRQELMNRFLWNEKSGVFLDYDEHSRTQTGFISAASFFPLFCGVADPAQSDRTTGALSVLETDYGLETCQPGKRAQNYQWDSPNLWPPLQWVAVSGLIKTGHKTEGQELARKFVATVVRNFKETGELWEKYNARTGSIDVTNEYEMPPMMGWTAGSFLACCDAAGL